MKTLVIALALGLPLVLIVTGAIYLLERALSVLCWLLFSRVDGENPPRAGEFDT